MIKITSNIKAIIKRFKRKDVEMKKVRFRAHRDIAILLDAWVLRNFKVQGKKAGGWQPFAVYCVGGPRSKYNKTKVCGRGRVIGKKKKRRLDKSAKLLQNKGILRASFRKFYSTKDAGIGSALDYAPPHEHGIKGRLPKRRMLPNIRDVSKDIKRKYEKYIKEAIDKR